MIHGHIDTELGHMNQIVGMPGKSLQRERNKQE